MTKLIRIPTSLGMAMVMVVAVAALPAAAETQPASVAATSPASADAAPYYRQAVDLLAADSVNVPDDKPAGDPAVAQFLERFKPALECLDAAAKLPTAKWAPGELTETATLGKLRHLANIGILRARHDLASGNKEQAMNDLLAVATLARHVGQEKLLITMLVEIGIEGLAIEQTARLLPDLGSDLAAKLVERLDALPPAASYGDVVLGEYGYAREMAKQGNAPGLGWDQASIAAAKPFFDAVAKDAALAPEEFAKKVDEALGNQPPNVLPLATQIAQSLKPARVPAATIEAKRAMLKTAATIVATSPDAVKQSKDPFGAGPFGYRAKSPTGFELTSQLIARKKPVTLTVGR